MEITVQCSPLINSAMCGSIIGMYSDICESCYKGQFYKGILTILQRN